ncbi:MAG: VWA domain-containing protein [Rhodospirillales bacterium]|nr:VWA domain-containing protein [Acetobacter sp.]
MEQNPFGVTSDDLMLNPEPRCPSLVLLDVSGSMAGEPIRQLVEGMSLYRDELAADSMASKRVEVAVVTFGGSVQVAQPFCNADQFTPLTFQAGGDTPMGQAIVTGLDLLENRKSEIRQGGVGLFRPWVFLITDGGPTDVDTSYWSQARTRVQEGESKGSFMFFAVGVKGANVNRLRELGSARPPVTLDGLRFRDLFAWLSASQKVVSQSQPGDKLALPPVSWGSIEA